MLETLHIRNLALVPELDIDFGAGLNTVTGETGAGKSLIIGAVQLLAGGRATPSLIRQGTSSCEVAGVIVLSGRYAKLREETDARLDAAGIPPCEEGRLIIRRVITESGSRAYVNGSLVTAGFLKELCAALIDLHGPHDNQTLLQPSMQLALLDTFAGLQPQTAAVRSLFDELSGIRRERESLASGALSPEEAELFAFQLKEIESAALTPGEEDSLVQRYRLFSHSRRLIELTSSVQRALVGDEGSLLEQLASQLRRLHELEQLDPDGGASIISRLEDLSSAIQDIGGDIGDYAEKLDVDQEEFERISRRLDTIQRMKRKYGPTVDDAIACGKRIRERLERLRNMDGALRELDLREESLRRQLAARCAELHEQRVRAASALEKAISGKLRRLGFAKSAFQVAMTPCEPGPSGSDIAEYRFSPNVGEDLKPLRQIASSGEVARVMLAVKAVLSEADNVPVLIFDEIDANVGGRVAVSVAEELRAVAEGHQVFSITHLPQIAASGSSHFLVSKHVEDGRTCTDMVRLEGKKRLEEIVRMLGAEAGSATALAHARELLRGFAK